MTMHSTYDFARDDRRLRDYLLRHLPDDQAERVEEAAIVDDEVAERLRWVEEDLVDAYVRDRLDPDTRQRFETRYLASPRRRERVRLAADFLRAIDAVPAAWEPEVAFHRRSRGWQLLAVAAVLLLSSGTVLYEMTNLSRNATGQRAAVPFGEPSRAAAPAASPGADGSLTLVLSPQTRAVEAIPALRLAAGAESVRLTLRLETAGHLRYQAGLRDPATNTILWRSAWIVRSVSDGRPVVQVVVPAAMLRAQHYSLDLSGRAAGGAARLVGSYAFSVTPP